MPISSIWNNDFYKNKPIPKWSFEINFQNYFINQSDNGVSFANTLSQAAVSCSWGARDANLISTYYAGIEAKLPGRANMAKELTVKFNENATFAVSQILEEIYHAEINCDSYFKNKGGYAYNKTFNKTKRSIEVKILRPDILMQQNNKDQSYSQNILAYITYHNCILYKIDEQELSYESDDEVITRTATFSYDYMTVKGNTPASTLINYNCLVNE